MKTGKIQLLGGAAAVALLASVNAGQAQDANGDLAARVQSLEDRQNSDHARLSTLEQNFNYAVWTYDNGRPVLSSGDGRFTMGIRVRFQSDFAGFSQDSTHPANFAGPADLSSGMVVRRAYIGVEGKVYSDFAYEIRLNAGGSDGGNNPTCTNPTVTSTTTLTGVPGGSATTSTAAGCAIGSIEPAGEGDPLLNKAVITYTGVANMHFNVGVIEPAFMFEGTTSSASLMFLERPEIDNIAADSFGAGDSRRGIELGWSKQDTLWAGDNLAFMGAFTGGKTGSAATHGNGGDENSQVLGRISERLWTDGISNVQIGASAASVLYSGSNGTAGGSQTLRFRDRPEIRVDGTRLISTGGIAAKTGNMFAVDAGGNWQNFFLGGEYAEFTADRQCGAITAAGNAACTSSTAVIDHPNFSGWYVEGSWILTGETKVYSPSAINNEVGGFNMPVPSRPFSLNGDSWGAWEFVARYSDTNLNWNGTQAANTTQLAGILGGDERVLALGLNWYLNRTVRLMLDDNIVTVKKGTAAIPNRDGQSLNIVGVRLQFAN